MMFWTLVVAAVITWARTSMRTPLMPIGTEAYDEARPRSSMWWPPTMKNVSSVRLP